MKSLKASNDSLSKSNVQIEVLQRDKHELFTQKLNTIGLFPLTPAGINTFQVNVGKMCNQVCKHCHVDAGPDRKEIMTRQTMEAFLDLLSKTPQIHTVDLTGGAPELNPDFRWFVTELRKLKKHLIVRCNLTIILANKRFYDLPQFYREHEIEVVSSLPFYSETRTDRQRGDGVFKDSLTALKMLNEVGYGIEGSGYILNLVYNPAGAFLPPVQSVLEKEYKLALKRDFQVEFNQLYVITNMPISRYLQYLLISGNYEEYMDKLVNAFNPATASGVMCRTTLSVSWDGYLYDCDFNQMLDLKIDQQTGNHLSCFDWQKLNERSIILNQHCYGCTAGAGSSCGGSIGA